MPAETSTHGPGSEITMVLASASPARLDTLRRAGIEPIVQRLPVGPAVERAYGRRLQRLPETTRAALLIASEPIFVTLKLAGAAYLVFLGAQMLFGALKPGHSSTHPLADGSTRGLVPLVAFRQGLISNFHTFCHLFPSLALPNGPSLGCRARPACTATDRL